MGQLTWGVYGGFAKSLVNAGHTVLAVDLYGHGHSDAPDTWLSVDDFVDQVVAVLKHLGVLQPFTLIGFSFGCTVAAAYAVKFPATLKKLVLLSPFGVDIFFYSWRTFAGIYALFM